MEGVVKLMDRTTRKRWGGGYGGVGVGGGGEGCTRGAARGIWLQNISGSGTWLSAQILQPRESFYSCWRQNHCRLFFPPRLPPSKSPFLLHATDWVSRARALVLLCRRSAIPSHGDECLKMQTLRRYLLFFFSPFFFPFKPAWNSSPRVYLYLSWPGFYLWVNFHYNSITRQGIELSEPLQGWISVEKWFKPSTLLTLPKKSSWKIYQKKKKKILPQSRDTSISTRLLHSLSAANCLITHRNSALLRLYSVQDIAIKSR